MREIIIERAKRMECCAVALQVRINGEKKGKVKNGEELVLTADDGAVELQVGGGFWSGKKFRDTIVLPAGTQSYRFRVEFVSMNNSNYYPLLRPYQGDREKTNDLRLVQILGAELTRLLLNEKLLASMRKLPEARLQLTLQPDAWLLSLSPDLGGQVIYRGQFADATLGLTGALSGLIERTALNKPEKQREYTAKLVAEYACALPQYRLLGDNEFTFVG